MKIIIVDDDCLVAGALKTILEVNEDVEVLATGSRRKRGPVSFDERYEPDVASYGYSNGENGRSGSIPEYFVHGIQKAKYSASYHFFR